MLICLKKLRLKKLDFRPEETILTGIGNMSQATEPDGQLAIDSAAFYSVVLASRGDPIIRNRCDAKVQVTKSTLDALAAAASIS
jgi:hypothetical protein